MFVWRISIFNWQVLLNQQLGMKDNFSWQLSIWPGLGITSSQTLYLWPFKPITLKLHFIKLVHIVNLETLNQRIKLNIPFFDHSRSVHWILLDGKKCIRLTSAVHKERINNCNRHPTLGSLTNLLAPNHLSLGYDEAWRKMAMIWNSKHC